MLRLAAAGCANKEIAHHLGNIRKKLKVATRLEAILWFKEHGFHRDSEPDGEYR